MNFPSRYRVRLAVAEDAAEVSRVFSRQRFEGGIAVAFLRDPDPINSFLQEGDELVMILLEDLKGEAKIVGFGGCVIREGCFDGKICRVGYLTGLKLLEEYRGKIAFIPVLYEEMYRLTRDKVAAYYTTILSDNHAVQTMLEKRRRRMPEYCFLGEYHTYFCKTNRALFDQLPREFEVKDCSGETAALFYREECEKGCFAVGDALQNDLKRADFYGLYREGALQAVGYVLDQREYKQYMVHHYGGIFKLLSKLPTGLLGYPDFPKAGETANCAAAGVWISRGAASPARCAGLLFSQIRRRACQFDFLIIGAYENSTLMEAFRGEKKIDYRSRVYQVCWDRSAPSPKDKEVQLEVALL